MPEQDGLEVIRVIRRLCPKLPIIAMSGMTGKLNMLRVAKSLGASRTLMKPFSKDELLEVVAVALGSVNANTLFRMPGYSEWIEKPAQNRPKRSPTGFSHPE